NVADAGGSLTVTNLAARGNAVNLGAGHSVGTLAGTAVAGDFNFTDIASLTVGSVAGFVGITAPAGNVTLTADTIDVTQQVNAAANRVTLRPRTAGRAIDLGGADSATALG